MAIVSAEAAELKIEESAESIVVLDGEQSIFIYRKGPNPFKPYVESLRTPSGLQILQDRPEDHKHHHGLMFAFRVDDSDFWAEHESALDPAGGKGIANIGKQVPRSDGSALITTSATGKQIEIRTYLEWLAGDSRPLLNEERVITLHPQAIFPECTLLTWVSRLKTPDNRDSVKLWGSHYNGLGMRLVSQMDNQGTVLVSDESEGDNIRGEEQLYSGPWCGFTSPHGEEQVTIVMLDHPENKRPAKWFTMTNPFSYIAATIGLHQNPLILKQNDVVDLKYGIAFVDGRVSSEQIEFLYQSWLDLVR